MTSEGRSAVQRPSPLRIYLRYEFLTVSDFSQLLGCINDIHNELFWADIPALIGTPHRRQYDLRIEECETGQSIYIDLVNALQQAVTGLDPALAGAGGGVAVAALTARLMIYVFKNGHEALSEARQRTLRLEKERNTIDSGQSASQVETQRAEIELATARSDAQFREFVQSALRTTASVDFAAAAERQEPLTERLGAALLGAWAVLQQSSIISARINDVEIKAAVDERNSEDHFDAGSG